MTKKRVGERDLTRTNTVRVAWLRAKGTADMNDMMLEATRLTRANQLIEATALIQRMLQGEIDSEIADPGDRRPTIGGHPEIFDETKPFPFNAAASDQSHYFQTLRGQTYRFKFPSRPDRKDGRGRHRYPRRTFCLKAGNSSKRFIPIRREAAPTSYTSLAAIRANRFPWLLCCTAALKRLMISPPGRE